MDEFSEAIVETVQSETVQAAVNLANQEFIKGFLAGQIILCLLIFFLLKIFLFRGGRETKIELIYRRMHRLPVRVSGFYSPEFTADILFDRDNQIPIVKKTTDRFILSKLQHDVQNTESCGWLSLLIARLLSEYRDNGLWKHSVMANLDQLLNATPSDFMSPITITEFNLGEDFPIFKNATVQLSAQERLTFFMDFSFKDQITLGIDTSVLVNWPKPGMASLPVSLSVSITEFSGTIRFEVEPGTDSSPPYLCFSLMESTQLELEIKSLLGHRTKIKDLPKLTSLINAKLKTAFVEQCVFPKVQRIPLPVVPSEIVMSRNRSDSPSQTKSS